MAKSKPNDYLQNSNLIREIIKSQEIQAKLPEEEREARVAECLTPALVKMIRQLVENLATSYRWCGYTWNDDMQADALAYLCKTALKFNIEKGQNPFAYYTQIAKRAFMTYVEKEKKQGKIRDDIIEMANKPELLPSFARQNENETNSLGIDLDGTKTIQSDPRKRRRKKLKVLKEDDTSSMSDAQYNKWIKQKTQEFMERKKNEPINVEPEE